MYSSKQISNSLLVIFYYWSLKVLLKVPLLPKDVQAETLSDIKKYLKYFRFPKGEKQRQNSTGF